MVLTVGCAAPGDALVEQALEVDAEARQGPCRLHSAGQPGFAAAMSLSGDQIAACLSATETAIALLEDAQRKGTYASDLDDRLKVLRDRQAKLTPMLHAVRQMERDGSPPTP